MGPCSAIPYSGSRRSDRCLELAVTHEQGFQIWRPSPRVATTTWRELTPTVASALHERFSRAPPLRPSRFDCLEHHCRGKDHSSRTETKQCHAFIWGSGTCRRMESVLCYRFLDRHRLFSLSVFGLARDILPQLRYQSKYFILECVVSCIGFPRWEARGCCSVPSGAILLRNSSCACLHWRRKLYLSG